MHIWQWIKKEIIHVLPAVIFFAIAFNLINFTEDLMLRPFEHNKLFAGYLTATIGALLVGKLLIIVDSMPFVNAFPNKPLIYNISWRFS